MPHESHPDDLVLHGVRVLGYAGPQRIGERFGVAPPVAAETLLDLEALGLVRQHAFGGDSGWAVTERGRDEDERRLAAELDAAGCRELVAAVHDTFLPLNDRFSQACTDWQLRPTRWDHLALNDHTDHRWDDRVLTVLTSLGARFVALCEELTDCLLRFDSYADLYVSALQRVESGQHAWVDAADRDSLHLLWIQFHEDLLSTLGLDRSA